MNRLALGEVNLSQLTSSGILENPKDLGAMIFEIDCDDVALNLPHLERLLDAQERETLQRLRVPHQRQRATVMRAALRSVVGAILKLPPQQVSLLHTATGQPCVHGLPVGQDIGVSSTTSSGLGAIAVAFNGVIGIDMEHVAPERFPDELAAHMLHARELALFLTLPPPLRPGWLTSAWVSKEAALKAMGHGLGADPRTVEVIRSTSPAQSRASEFRPAGLAHFRGWLWRSGVVTTACVASRQETPPRTVRLAL